MLSKHAIVPPSYNTLHLWNRIGGNWVSPDSNILKRECFHSIPLDVDRDESPPRSDFFLQMYLKIWNEIGLKMNLKEFDSRIGILESIDWLKLIRVIDREESLPIIRSDFFLLMYLQNMKIDLKMNVKEFDRRELESRNRPIVSTQVNSRQRQISIKFLSTNISRE